MSTDRPFTAVLLRPYLESCGYRPSLLRGTFPVSDMLTVPLAAFAHPPVDARTACIAVIDSDEPTRDLVASCRPLAAPIVLVCGRRGLAWWQQGAVRPERIGQTVPPIDVPRFFETHRYDFSPDAVYRAKTWGRFDQQSQLSFVGLGLMPLVEAQIGEGLTSLIARNVQRLKALLGWETLTDKQAHWLLQEFFWLVSAKILRDKAVDQFKNIDLLDVGQVLAAVADHYGTTATRCATAT